MRLGLGFVLGWFGVHELHSPSEWAVFVPSFVGHISPVGVNELIILHGFLLLLAAVAIVIGLMYLPACLLGMALLGEIIFGLWYDGGISDLVIRDIGLLGLAGALAIDPSRYLHLQSVLSRPEASKSTSREVPVLLSGVVMAGLVVIVGAALYGSGGASSIGDASAITLATAAPAPVATAPVATAAAGPLAPLTPAPTQAPSAVRFDTWRYAQYSFQIYPGQPNSDTTKALAGFQLSVQDQGSTVLLQLKATDTRYKDASYTIDKANTAYFIETTMRDDPNEQEQNLGDDGVVAVDPQGFLVTS
jgi:hypothetical protein